MNVLVWWGVLVLKTIIGERMIDTHFICRFSHRSYTQLLVCHVLVKRLKKGDDDMENGVNVGSEKENKISS